MEKAIETINEFSQMVTKRIGKDNLCLNYDLEWRSDISGEIVREGDKIDLGGISATILEIPGHSSCAIATYVPQIKALFPTDGGGIPFDEIIITSGNSNFTRYQQSLEKMKDLEVEYYCADHYGYVIGYEAREFISKTIEVAQKNRLQIEETYLSTNDIEVTAKKLVHSLHEEYKDYFLPQEILLDVYRQMVRHIASVINKN